MSNGVAGCEEAVAVVVVAVGADMVDLADVQGKLEGNGRKSGGNGIY